MLKTDMENDSIYTKDDCDDQKNKLLGRVIYINADENCISQVPKRNIINLKLKESRNELNAIQACRVCFNTENRLYELKDNLLKHYENMIGEKINQKLPQLLYICLYCKRKLDNSLDLIDASKTAHLLLKKHIRDELTSNELNIMCNLKLNNYNSSKIEVIDNFTTGSSEEKYENEITEVSIPENVNDDLLETSESLEEEGLYIMEVDDEWDVSEDLQDKRQDEETVIESKEVECDEVEITRKKQDNMPIDISDIIETVKLTMSEQREHFLKRKESNLYVNALYKCDLCLKGFNYKHSFENHKIHHTEKYGPKTCPICQLNYSTKTFKVHLNGHAHIFKCKSCSFVTSCRSAAVAHVNIHKQPKYECKYCYTVYSHPSSYLSHLRLKHPSPFSCELCGFSFLSESGVRSHKRRVHSNDERMINEDSPRCQECDVQFIDADVLTKHIEAVHCKTKRNQVYYTRPKNSRYPSKTFHGEIKCEECGKLMETFRKYKFHYKREHPGKTRTTFRPMKHPHLCDVCGMKFRCRAVLQDHMSVHVGQTYKCDICNKSYKKRSSLRTHINIHNAPRIACKLCDQSFANNGNYKRHVFFQHTEYKIVKCELCGKELKNDVCLKHHIDHVHLGKPYKKRIRKKTNQKKNDDNTSVINK